MFKGIIIAIVSVAVAIGAIEISILKSSQDVEISTDRITSLAEEELDEGGPVGDGIEFSFEIGDIDFRKPIVTSFLVKVLTSDNIIPVQFDHDFCQVTSSEDLKTKTYSFRLPTAPEGHILLVKFIAKAKKNDKAWKTPYSVIGYIPMTDLKLLGKLETDDLFEIEKNGKSVMTAWGSYVPLKQWYHLDTNSEFEETKVFVHDFSGNKNYGVVHGDAVIDKNGAQRRTFFLDGIDDYISIANSESINDIPMLTYSAWVNPIDRGNRTIISKKGSTRELAFIGDNQHLRGCVAGSTVSACSESKENIQLDKWQYVTMTYNGFTDKTVRLYINGIEVEYAVQTVLEGDLVSDADSDLNIGRRTDGANYFEGRIDEVAIWNTVFTPEQILDLYNSFSVPLDSD